MPLLNLSDNEQRDFDAVPSGRYFAEVYECEERETGPGGKLPEGTPMIWIHFKITGKVGEDDGPNEESEWYNRRVFRNMIVPPETLDGKPYKNYKMFNGQIVRFFLALGFSEDEVTAGDFEPELEDQQEKPLIIQVQKKKVKGTTDEFNNEVTGFRRTDEVETTTSGGLL